MKEIKEETLFIASKSSFDNMTSAGKECNCIALRQDSLSAQTTVHFNRSGTHTHTHIIKEIEKI